MTRADTCVSPHASCSARYSYVCCEIFTCEVEAMFNTILDENGQVRLSGATFVATESR